MAAKPNCLIVCSSASQGVSAQSFIQAFTLTHSVFNVQIATPQGHQIDFVKSDENSRKWLNEFRTKPFSFPGKLEDVDASRYGAILIPSSPGALHDLAQNTELAKLLNAFIHEKKPICAIGHGVGALCAAKREGAQSWGFKSYSVTGPSVFESARSPDFSSLPLIIEDWIKDNGGTYSASEPDGMHVIIDRHLITGQNDTSTLSAVQNLILLCNARQGKTKS
ncbi:PREDICTED: Parkinson disease 7 domain-containing protein 1-like isoform X2 [Acropora digitifera]|uniref:Parkinson disease 7 domain-containing protein 1-like isoform X2 n=1 Tax=Acropora digitifera TaxID=70779 RepID=UPI00077A9519|nr:PREDICTED: Parkinson disease 7 domain-containing protein 1-like isoform X2 [Acropora digitifera]